MKRLLFLVPLILACGNPPPPPTPLKVTPTPTPVKVTPDPDFRDSLWGMTHGDVGNKGEVITLTPNLDVMMEEDCHVAGFSCIAAYYFLNDKLVMGKFIITTPHADKTLYLQDYDSLVTKLTAKYGKPVQNEFFWRNDLYRNDPEQWGMAVAVGHLSRIAHWVTPRTEVWLGLKGDNYEVHLRMDYSFVSYKEDLADEMHRLQSEGL